MTAERNRRAALAWRVGRGLLLATAGIGLVAVLVPGVARLLPVETAVLVLGSDYVVVAVVGVLAVGLSVVVVVARHVRGVHEVNPPVVEGVQSASYPGTDFDRTVESRLGDRAGGSDDRRARLREAATRATMRTDGCPRGVAERRVARGEWTDDSVASRYLRDRRHADGVPDDGWDTNRDERAARRTVDAIVEPDGTGSESAGRRRNAVEGR